MKEEIKEEIKEEPKSKLAPPWIQYANEIISLFGQDPEIKINYDNDSTTLKLFIDSEVKAEAISKLIPCEKSFGNVILKIEIVPSNDESAASLFRNAFANNPVFSYVKTVEGVFTNPVTYVVFNKQIIQYYNDDLSDINGNRTTLCQEIAKDIFNKDGVFFCTDVDK